LVEDTTATAVAKKESSTFSVVIWRHPWLNRQLWSYIFGVSDCVGCQVHSYGWRRSAGCCAAERDLGDRAPTTIAAITRARVRTSAWRTFSSAVPAVAAAANEANGLLLSTGIGEAPIGLQGTFSIWRDVAALRGFAQSAAHQQVVDRTSTTGWYSEELFARFSVQSAMGSFCQKSVDFLR
jgi:hypothetical protein